MTLQPRRVFSSAKTNPYFTSWLNKIAEHKAVRLLNGENPSDFPNDAVAFETQNFGWILSKPVNGVRRIVAKD